MPIVFILLLPLLLIALVPVLFVVRFRLGIARRRAKPWVAKLNVFVLAVSIGLLLISASILNIWVADAVKSAVIGVAAGGLLSLFGLAATHWERTSEGLFYKPNRWFALLIPLALTTRIIFWIWRGWHVWWHSENVRSWLAGSGTAASLGIGAMVAGYYFGYAIGVWYRVKQLQSRIAAR
ncbi:MAG: hypothetical protein ACJ8M1_13255 [Chthoniobacterales bacterium]